MPICKSLGHRLALKLYNYSWAHEWLRNKYYAMSECFWMHVFCAAFNTQILSDTYPAWQPISNCDLAQRKSGTVWLHKLSVYIVIQHHIIIIPISEANPDISGCNLSIKLCTECMRFLCKVCKTQLGQKKCLYTFFDKFWAVKIIWCLGCMSSQTTKWSLHKCIELQRFWKLYRSN